MEGRRIFIYVPKLKFLYNDISMDWISVKCNTANEKHCIINSRAASETASGKYFSEPVDNIYIYTKRNHFMK
jgi:hypothetical protein